MPIKHLKDKKILDINGFLIHLEIYDSCIVIKDQLGNSMKITKKSPQSIVLNSCLTEQAFRQPGLSAEIR